jgi:ribulose-5-phosphate 4-epimerase/fuculose-1-phosphate aldolase
MPLHSAFYDTRSAAGAVVHLHSCHSVALSMLPDADPDNFLPPLTPYAIMKLGKVRLLPFFLPGDPAMGEAVRGLAGKRSAVMLANHGPVVAGKRRGGGLQRHRGAGGYSAPGALDAGHGRAGADRGTGARRRDDV